MADAIVHGMVMAILHALGLVPITVWLILFLALIAFVFVLRYATNWKVDATILVLVFIGSEGLAWRQHWIDMGRKQIEVQVQAAEDEVEAFKRTNQLVIECYQDDPAAHVWDRSVGKCLRRDGAVMRKR